MQSSLRILFINQYAWPDSAATAQILADLTDALAARGHTVTVVCSAGWYDAAPVDAPRRPSREIHNRVEYIRLPAFSLGRRSKLSQLVDFISFHLLAAAFLLRHAGEFDIVISLTTPPLIALHASVARHLTPGLKHIHWCMNLHPDVEIEMGLLKGFSAQILAALTTWQLRTSDAVVSLGHCMTRRLLAKGVPAARIIRIPMWALSDVLNGGTHTFRDEWNLQDKFVVMHAGNAGAICTFDIVTSAALALRDDPRFLFLFTGGGRRIRELTAFAAKHHLTNLRTAPYVSRKDLPKLLRTADVHLLSLRPELAGTSVPSKLYGIMATAKPAIFIGDPHTESADALSRFACGFTVSPGDTATFLARLKTLASSPNLCHALGASGRQGYLAEYNALTCTSAWTRLIEAL